MEELWTDSQWPTQHSVSRFPKVAPQPLMHILIDCDWLLISPVTFGASPSALLAVLSQAMPPIFDIWIQSPE